MPVYNGEKYLKEAIESILNQTFKDFEFLIINDGSNDTSIDIIKSYNDHRIRLEHNENNRGLIYSLNKGVKLASGEYIARMDADDISLPNRLAVQVDFMDKHKNIGISGSNVKVIGKKYEFTGHYLTSPAEIKANLIFNTSLAHPTVIFRKEILVKNNLIYDENFKHAEDYDLWERAVKITKISNIPMVLMQYRKHLASVSGTYKEIQAGNAKIIRQRQLARLGIYPTDKEILIHSSLLPADNDAKNFIGKQENWLKKLLAANYGIKYYDQKAFAKIISERWFTACYANSYLDLWILKKYFGSSLSYVKIKNIELLDIVKLILKCIIKRL